MTNKSHSQSRRRTRHQVLLALASLLLLTTLSSFPLVSSAVLPTVTTTTSSPSSTAVVASPIATANFILPTSTPAPTTSPSNENNSSANASLSGCPPPMVPNIYNLTTLGCTGPCCLPCPVSSVFYEPHKLENVYTITSVVRFISAAACMFLSICYLILPGRRRHPHLIVLLFAMLMVPWEALGTAWLFKKEKLLCKNVFEIADMTNSWFCGVQVYRSSLIQGSLSKLMVVSFILPLALVIPVVVKKQIMNPGFGSICFVGPDVASAFFFYPLSVVVCVATLLHLGTIGFMIKTAVQANSSSSVGNSHSRSYGNNSNGNNNPAIMTPRQRRLQTARDISQLLKQQWRPGLFALWLLVIDMIYWLFYFIEAKKLLSVGLNPLWFQQWVACLAEQAIISVKARRLSMANPTPDEFLEAGEFAQKMCAEIAAPFVPNFAWAALSDMLPALSGIVILIIFGSKLELWHDLRKRLVGRRGADGGNIMMGDIFQERHDKMYAKGPSSGTHKDNSPSSALAAAPLSAAAPASPSPHRQERYRRDLKVTTQKLNDGFYDEDLTYIDNPYGSQTNLTPTGRISFQKINNGGPILKNQAEYNNNLASPENGGTYRNSTPEPWKPSVWINTTADTANPSTDDYSIKTAYRSTSQLRINTHSSPFQRPAVIGGEGSLSPLSPQRQFYSSEDLDAIPVSLTTPPPTYSSNSSGNAYREPVSPRQNKRSSNSAYNSNQSNATFASDTSRGRAEYNADPRLQQYHQQQEQQQPQSPTSPIHALSPPPSRPNKSMARNR
ncbi:hypothetical protein BG015_006178 [Linnemannia schmuckeri]|uniref:Uncharacterized protein n=1 Tax=Linnemannia schmuckeri TaxID=64567 RepID=A0A9P5VBN9_9FUNG|nr:hypothetical protein BG015_006178 [Linnemannia schmuckeri]